MTPHENDSPGDDPFAGDDPIADPLAEPAATTPEPAKPVPARVEPAAAPSREHAGGVLGVTLGLLFLIALVFGLLQVRGGEIDGEARLAELVEGEPPFGLTLADAARLTTGEQVVRLEGPEDSESGPNEVYLVEYPALSGVKKLFPREEGGRFDGGAFEASGKMLAWERDPSFEWHTTLERNEVAWRTWRTDYVVERLFLEGGDWRDSVRVDLAQPDRFLVLIALWPVKEPFDRDALEILLRSVTMTDAAAR